MAHIPLSHEILGDVYIPCDIKCLTGVLWSKGVIRVRKIGAVGLMIVIIGLAGCGQPTWITIWSGASHPMAYFIVGNSKVPLKDIGGEYSVLSVNHGGSEISDRLPLGTNIYTIRGENPSKELAVETTTGNFVKATYWGTSKP